MPGQTDKFVVKAKQFLELLKSDGINVSQAYLFGSVVKGLADEYSDIDLALVSSDFQGIPYYDMGKISKYRRKVDLRLEIHPFSLEEVNLEPSQFFENIRKTGLRIDHN